MVHSTFVLILLAVVPGVFCYREYVDKIPNGGRVPVPCKNNILWHGVGHLNVQGGGDRNVFGIDFAAAGHSWTTELCNKDSDGDGRTNGQELGDPQCIWRPGDIPASTTGITHPGACEPLDSDVCSEKQVPNPGNVPFKIQREWMADACKSAEFVCNGLNATADVRQLDLRVPLTAVPPKETTYICMMFEVNDTIKAQDFHIIATEPIINNSYVMHHMLLFGCPDDAQMYGPVECNMGGCPDLIGAWALGITGQCFHDNAGVRIGNTGYKRMMIQYHWNNPAEMSTYMDSSGLKLYYTPNLRPNDMAMLMTGQNFIAIPPRSIDVMVTSDCSGTCTRNLFTGDIYVTTAANHMHYLGMSMSMEHYRDGQRLRYFTNEAIYHYDTPKFSDFQDPIQVKPGDMIRTTCHFSAPDKTVTTFEGDSTSDEMCYGFITFYPASNIPDRKQCVSWRSIADCDPQTTQGCDRPERRKWIKGFNQTEVYSNITSSCKKFGVCTAECRAAIRQAKSREACMKSEDGWRMVKWYFLAGTEEGREFLAAMESCAFEMYEEEHAGSGNFKDTRGIGNVGDASDSAAGDSNVERSSTLATVVIAALIYLCLA